MKDSRECGLSEKSRDVDFVRTGHTFNEECWLYLSLLLEGPRSGNPLSTSKWTLESNARKSLNLAALVASILASLEETVKKFSCQCS